VGKLIIPSRIAMQKRLIAEVVIPHIQFMLVFDPVPKVNADPIRDGTVVDAPLIALYHFPGQFTQEIQLVSRRREGASCIDIP
jgi:hypothetical protein